VSDCERIMRLRHRADRFVAMADHFGFEWTCPTCFADDDGYPTRADAAVGLMGHTEKHHPEGIG
jgi:hypothetical protein